jgi:(R,R)-butanediol dehydrogenase/meso-butanediol dehydrogenase/diacetyl reductase
MKAMVLKASSKMEEQDIPQPVPADGEALVRVTSGGICGTDLKIFDGSIPARTPLVIGHEVTGEIVAGKAADGQGPGTRVVLDPTCACRTCFHCKNGQTNLCPNSLLLGRERNGGFAEYTTIPEINAHAVPDDVDDDEAAFIQVTSTCWHAQMLANIVPGETVIVTGLGVTGQLHVQLAKALGAGKVIGITRSKWKRELAEKFGADITLAPDENTKERVLEETNGVGADLGIETAGKLYTLAQTMDLVRMGGRILPFSIYTEKEGKLPFYDFYFKELNIINARASLSNSFPASTKLVRDGDIQIKPLITHVLPISELNAAMEMLATDEPGRMKMIIRA